MSRPRGEGRLGTKAIPDPLRLVLFDLDDTLCDYSRARDLRLRRALGSCMGRGPAELKLDLDRLVEASIAIHPHGADHFPQLLESFGVADPALAEHAVGWYRRNRFFGLELFPEALDVIAVLRTILATPPTIGVVTNGPADVQRDKIALLGVDRVVDFVVISGEFGLEKPTPAIFEEALRLGRSGPQNAVMVGDSLDHDIAGAQAVGMVTVWINPAGDRPTRSGPEPDFVIRRLDELPRLLTDEGAGLGC